MTRPDEELAAGPGGESTERDLEAPAADAAEQSTPADPSEQPPEVHLGPEVGEWDALEQSIAIPLDDDYDA